MTWLSNIAFHLLPIWLQTLSHARHRFQAFVRAIWSCCADQFKSEQTPFPGACSNVIAFHLRPIGLQTLVVIDSESYQTLFQSFCAQQSEVAVLFDLNLSRRPVLRQVIDLDLLLCTGFYSEDAVLFLCHMFTTQRPMTDQKIERSDWRLWLATTSGQFDWKVNFTWKKKWRVVALYRQSIKTFWLLIWVSIARVVALFFQASRSLPITTGTD